MACILKDNHLSSSEVTLKQLFNACLEFAKNDDENFMWLQHQNIRNIIQSNTFVGESHISSFLDRLDRHKKILALYNELHEGNKDFSEIRVEEIPSKDFSLIANRDFAENDSFLKIPSSLILFADKFNGFKPYLWMRENDPLLNSMENVFLSLCVVLEFYRNTKSTYWSYLSSLPSRFNNVLYYEVNDFEILRFSPSFSHGFTLWTTIVRHYSYLHSLILKWTSSPISNPLKEFVISHGILEKFSLKDYFWGVSVVMTRNFFLPSPENISVKKLALVPLMDLCNHSFDQYEVFFDENTPACVGVSSLRVEKNQELCINYGNRSTSDYVICNGFFPVNNPHNTVVIFIPFSPSDKLRCKKAELLKTINLFPTFMVEIRDPFGWDGSLLAYMRLFSFRQKDLDSLSNLSHSQKFNLLSDPNSTHFSSTDNISAFSLISKLRFHISKLKSCPENLTDSSYIKENIKNLESYELQILEKTLNSMYQLFPTFAT